AITNFTNGTTDMRAIYPSVVNSNIMSPQTISILHLVGGMPSALLNEVQNVSIKITVNSQCSQPLTLSSDVVPVDISEAPTTTPSRTVLSATYSLLLLLLSVFIILMT
uniref:hypothetical protein n=1 Tax=Salmonella sp. s51228 TaxID=3159652 RepID=UPI00397ED24C